MPAEFTQGFFVREPAWHNMGVVLDDYPDRETAMNLAGHDFDVIEIGLGDLPIPAEVLAAATKVPDGVDPRKVNGWKAHMRSDNLQLLHVSKETTHSIPNAVPYEFAELMLDQGFKFEAGVSLRGGALNALTLYLEEPVVIPGDNSTILPYLGLSWAHDGTAALKGRGTSVRQVCANTVALSEMEGRRLGTDFTIMHTANWRDRVEEAKKLYKGVREDFEVTINGLGELAKIKITPDQRELFAHTLIPLKVAKAGKLVSDRVVKNVDEARAAILNLFDGPTIPEDHKLTAYGLHLAGVEYADHLRGYRSSATYLNRTLLKHDNMKASLAKVIKEVVAA